MCVLYIVEFFFLCYEVEKRIFIVLVECLDGGFVVIRKFRKIVFILKFCSSNK